MVTFDPEYDILAVFVDATEDKSRHEKAAIHVWNQWADKLAKPLDFRLFNFSEIPDERSRKDLLAAYQGELLFDRR
jgi:cAMP phosphodiesterase